MIKTSNALFIKGEFLCDMCISEPDLLTFAFENVWDMSIFCPCQLLNIYLPFVYRLLKKSAG